MANVFLAKLSATHKAQLEAAGIPAYVLTIGKVNGLVIDASASAKAMTVLDAYSIGEEDTAYEGIKQVKLRFHAARQMSNGRHKITADWEVSPDHHAIVSAERILGSIINRDIALHYRKKYCAPIEDGRFHIHVNSSPVEYTKGVRPPEFLFSIPVEFRDYTWPSCQLGTAIIDDASGYAPAEMVGRNNFYIYHDLFKTGSIFEELLFRQLLIQAMSMLDIPDEITHARYRAIFVDECSKSAVRELTSMATVPAAEKRKEKIQQLKKELSQAARQARLEELKLLRGELSPEKFGDEYDALLKIPKIKDVTVDDKNIVIYTRTLYCRDDRTGILHEIGEFRISLPMEGSQPKWTNLTRRVDACEKGMHAPHIFPKGNACMGTAKDIIPPMLEARQYALAAQLCIRFVESVNTTDRAGQLINHWPQAVR